MDHLRGITFGCSWSQTGLGKHIKYSAAFREVLERAGVVVNFDCQPDWL